MQKRTKKIDAQGFGERERLSETTNYAISVLIVAQKKGFFNG